MGGHMPQAMLSRNPHGLTESMGFPIFWPWPTNPEPRAPLPKPSGWRRPCGLTS
jgi:hypothetical protein